ncbi:MAG: MFS transporter [Candidatus Njordarchaeota archaeon]
MLRVNNEKIVVMISTIMYIFNSGILLIGLQVMFKGVVSDFKIAMLSVAYWIPIFIFSPVWGYLADASNKRKEIAQVTLIIVAFFTYLQYIFREYEEILFMRFIVGTFSASFTPAIQAYFTQDVSAKVFGKRIALYNTAVALGFSFSAYITSVILLFLDVYVLFIVASIFSLCSACVLIFLPNKENQKREIRFLEIISSAFSISIVRDLKKGRAYLLVIGLTIRHITVMGLFSLIFVYMQQMGIPRYLLGVVSAFNNITQVIFIPIFGYLSDILGRKRLFVPGFFLSALIPVFFIVAKDFIGFSIAFTFIGVAYSLLIAGANPYLRDIAPKGRESEILSLMNTTRAIGMIIGPLLVGLIVLYGSYYVMFICMLIIGFFATFLVLFVGGVDIMGEK